MAEKGTGVSITRMELLRTKQKIALVEKGHKALKEKQDILVMEFFKQIKELQGVRSRVAELMDVAYGDLALAEAMSGSLEISSLSKGASFAPELKTTFKNIMGVRIPQVEAVFPGKDRQRGVTYSFRGTSAKLEEAIESFREALKGLVKLVETEESLRRLAKEIKRTKRRVNAIEAVLLPQLIKNLHTIEKTLDERERENFYRLKTMKSKWVSKASPE